MALASRTHTPDLAVQLLEILHIPPPPLSSADESSISSEGTLSALSANPTTVTASVLPKRALDFFHHREIFPGDKRTHMKNLHKSSGAAYSDMLFFDDESRNKNVESLGVCFWLVQDGMSREEIDRGVQEWRKRQGKDEKEDL
jgi:magnesium-dependent phosphatase 1